MRGPASAVGTTVSCRKCGAAIDVVQPTEKNACVVCNSTANLSSYDTVSACESCAERKGRDAARTELNLAGGFTLLFLVLVTLVIAFTPLRDVVGSLAGVRKAHRPIVSVIWTASLMIWCISHWCWYIRAAARKGLFDRQKRIEIGGKSIAEIQQLISR